MEETDARIHQEMWRVGRPILLPTVPRDPSRSNSYPSANSDASGDRSNPACSSQSKEEALARTDLCSRWRRRYPVFAAGDLAYEKGSAEDFKNCYDPTWGRFRDRTKPALGNHEYADRAASGYFQYWGAQAGPPGKGFYSYDLGDWHIVVLNTNCNAKDLGGCATGSQQETWLKEDLAKHLNACILAYGHHALFSSGVFKQHAVHPELKQLWDDLYAAHADLVLAGHEHSYERFAPQDPEGKADPANGIREIVAGTGGRSHDLLGFSTSNSEVRNWETFGVLKLTLSPGKYSWEFIPEEGKSFHDSGSGVCHNYPTGAN